METEAYTQYVVEKRAIERTWLYGRIPAFDHSAQDVLWWIMMIEEEYDEMLRIGRLAPMTWTTNNVVYRPDRPVFPLPQNFLRQHKLIPPGMRDFLFYNDERAETAEWLTFVLLERPRRPNGLRAQAHEKFPEVSWHFIVGLAEAMNLADGEFWRLPPDHPPFWEEDYGYYPEI